MMSHDRHFEHGKFAVAVRWVELEPAGAGRRFTASYSITPKTGEPQPWRHLQDSVFCTFGTAADYALRKAQQSIDALGAAGDEAKVRHKPGCIVETPASANSHDGPQDLQAEGCDEVQRA